jgi:predicted AlkP superfamily phosphohydrolase/phosphomutase
MAIDTKKVPLIILGFDAADPDLLQRWAQEGHLPTLASIMKRGCWTKATGPELLSPHGRWLSLLSGISRSEHGYYYFRQLKAGTYGLEDVTARDAAALPFWSHLRGRDKRVAIIDAPDTDPLTGMAGIQLANWNVHSSSLPPSTEPAALLQEVRRVVGPPFKISERGLSDDHQIYRRLLERTKKQGALGRYLLSQDRFDLVVVVFSESHPAGHKFWQYRGEAQPPHAAAEESELTHALRDVYQEIDRQMGLLLAQLSHEANVFILSSTGLEDQYPTIGLIEDFCRKLGYQASSECRSPSLKPMAMLRRVVPKNWRTALSRYLPGAVRQRLRNDFYYGDTNWRKTTAFAIPSAYTSFVRVNLRGREPEGIVEPGAEYETLLWQLEADLHQLIDPHTGASAVKQVTRTVEAFHCGPPASLPDLFVEWKSGAHFIQRLVHPRAELVQPKPRLFRTNNHSSNAFVAAAGPSIQGRGALEDISPLDLAPTFLSLMGEPIPDTLTGKVMDALTHA